MRNKDPVWCILMQFETMFLEVGTAEKNLKTMTQS